MGMDEALFRSVRRLLEPIERRIKLVASKAIVELVKEDIGIQGLQVSLLAGEVADEATEHMQPGGLTHFPEDGAEGIYLSIGGVRDDGVVICVSERRYRFKDQIRGETSLYNTGERQSRIYLKQDGSIEVLAHTAADTPSRMSMRANGEIEIFASLGNNPSTMLLKADGAIEVTAGGGGNQSRAVFAPDSAITLSNDQATVEIAANGAVSAQNQVASVEMAQDGTITMTNGPGSFEMAPSGIVTINTVEIHPDGSVLAPGIIQADMEITAMNATPATAVRVSTHNHLTGTGPSMPPTPGS